MKYRGDTPTSTFVLAVLLTGFTAPAGTWVGQSAAAEFSFERFEVVTGPAKRQTVLTGFLLGGPVAELAVLTIDDSGDRLLRIYAFRDGAWAPGLEATLGPEVDFVDVAEIGGRDRLVTFAPGRLGWFDPESGTERPLVAASSNFVPPRTTEIPHVDVTHDVNGDGRDDLAVPDVDGFQVFIQTEGGAFADPVEVGRSTDMSRILGADGYRFDPWSQGRVHEVDYDGDGRRDLVFWNGDRFTVHLQDQRGLFPPDAETFAAGVAFDSDDLSSLAAGDMAGRVLHSLADLNGDGVADLVVFSLEGRNMSGKRSAFEVHFGARTPAGGTVFAPEAGARIESDGSIQLGMDRHDFDGDGRVGLMFTTIETRFLESSLWKRIKGFMGDDVVLKLEFYRTGDGSFPDGPGAIRSIALDGAPSHREPGWVPLDILLRGGTHESRMTQKVWPRAFNRTLLIGDVTGDGRPDLLIEPEFRELHVYAGVPGAGLFAQKPRRVEVSLHDGEYAWLADLDRDGRQDIIVHQPFNLRDVHGARKLPLGTEPHRVTVLMAR
ncbi:MAG: VCBS repeat-containing protein [Gemmatimonadetes bacterium]|nr:VCBS repeat-containing protein [Gemmatimonadota bacterium]